MSENTMRDLETAMYELGLSADQAADACAAAAIALAPPGVDPFRRNVGFGSNPVCDQYELDARSLNGADLCGRCQHGAWEH